MIENITLSADTDWVQSDYDQTRNKTFNSFGAYIDQLLALCSLNQNCTSDSMHYSSSFAIKVDVQYSCIDEGKLKIQKFTKKYVLKETELVAKRVTLAGSLFLLIVYNI